MSDISHTTAVEDRASHAQGPRSPLLGMNLDELTALVKAAGFPGFRARQLHHWLYRKVALDFSEMHNLARDFRLWLIDNCDIGHIAIAEIRESGDGARKIAFRLRDGNMVEGVLMREPDPTDPGTTGEDAARWWTLCVSSQVGCALGCAFCLTGYGGFRRNLTSSEILSQVLLTQRHLHGGKLPRNVVFMGMGEPLLNLDEVIRALHILCDPDAMAVAARRVTVSTAGIVPGIERLASENVGVSLAVSLNAPDDTLRRQLMPVARKYSIEALMEACRAYPLKRRRRITFEYVLIAGLNDSPGHARALADLLRPVPCKINLIPWNPDPRLPFARPDDRVVERFQQCLLDCDFSVSVRYSKGLDVGAACGQLAGHVRSHEERQQT